MEFGKEPTPTRGTRIEQLLHDLLASLGFYVEDSVRAGPWELDCFVRELHLGFEADGPTHSGHRQVKDARRDAQVREQFGIEVLRVPGALLTEASAALSELIETFIYKHADTAAARRVVVKGAW